MSLPIHSNVSKISVPSTSIEDEAQHTLEKERRYLSRNKAKRAYAALDIIYTYLNSLEIGTEDLLDNFLKTAALVDVPRKLTADEKGSAAFKMNCRLARSYLDIILRTNLVKIAKDRLDTTLRNFLFLQFLKNCPKKQESGLLSCFNALKELKVDDVDGYKKIVSSIITDTNFANLKSKLGEQSEKPLKALLNQPSLMGVSIKEILLNGLEENHPAFFKMITQFGYPSSSTSQRSIYDAFTNRFFYWIMEQNDLSDALSDCLLALWEDLKQEKNIPQERWIVQQASPIIQQQLLEFQTIYKSIHIKIFNLIRVEPDSLKKTTKVPQLSAGQITNLFTIWNKFFDEITTEQKRLVTNFRSHIETLLDFTFEKTKQAYRKNSKPSARVILDEKKHRKHVRGMLQSDEERQFIRLCSNFEQTWTRKLTSLSEEVALLKKTPKSADLLKWSLFATIEPILKHIEEIKKLSTTMKKAAKDILDSGLKMNQPMTSQESILIKKGLTIWTAYEMSMERFYSFTQNWIETLQNDLETCFIHENANQPIVDSASNDRDYKEGISSPKPVAKKIFTKEALRKKIAYEILNLPDLVDLDAEIFVPSPAKKDSSKDHKNSPKTESGATPSSPSTQTAAQNTTTAAASIPAISLASTALTSSSTTVAKQEALNKELVINLQAFENQITNLEKPSVKSSFIAAITPYSLTTAQLLREELILDKKSPLVHSILEVEYSKTIQECCDHFFLLTQGMELISNCVLQKRFDLLLPVYRAYLIDSAVAVEQRLAAEILSKKQKMYGDHELEALAFESGLPMDLSQKEFLRDFRRALIWARYPASSLSYFSGNDACPPPIHILGKLLKQGVTTKETLTPFLNDLFKNYQRVLSIILGPVISQSKTHKQFLQQCDKLLNGLTASLSHPAPATAFSVVGNSPINKAKTAIDTALGQCKYVQSYGETDATLHLQEVSYYLKGLELSHELKKLFPSPHLAFWHMRNALEVEKIFKHLYETDCLLYNLGSVRRHGFFNFAEALKGIRDDLSKELPFLKTINLKIAHHYHTMPSPLGSAYPLLLQQCQASVQGFELASKPKISEKNFPNLEQAFALFEQQFPATLRTLKEQEASIQKQARERDNAVIRG